MERPGAAELDSPYEVQHTEDRGRVLVASRFLARGKLVLQEPALLMAPASRMPMCIRCFKFTDDCERPLHCARCGFGYCGLGCQASLQEFHEVECMLLRHEFFKDWLEKSPMTPWAICRGLAVKVKRPEAWQELLKLQVASAPPEHADLYAQVLSITRGLREFQAVAGRDVEHILGACNTYGHLCWRAPQEQGEQLCTNTLLGLFPVASIPEHSCVPSCFKSFWHSGGEIVMQLRTLRDVQPGESLSLPYTNLSEPTHLRQAALSAKRFRCSCARCRDPVELGSHLSSVRCPACGSGFVSPPCVDYDLAGKSWACSHCPVQLPWKALRAFEASMEARLLELEQEVLQDYEAKGLMVEFRASCCQRLHPRHWVLLRCNLAIGTFHQQAMLEEPALCKEHGILEACDDALVALESFGPEVDDSRARLYQSRSAALGDAELGAESARRARELRVALYGMERAEAVA